jgi:hypothetical protein
MTSTNGTSPGDFDERLVEALEGVLINGEEVIAQEVGDQGQAIVLTGSRIIVIKAGLAATGELNGHRASAFALDSITAVNLRKGPLGAVIQVCADAAQCIPDGARPDNVVVFTGPGRVKKADIFAAAVESAAGKTVNRVDPRVGEQHVDKPVVHEATASGPVTQAQEVAEVSSRAPAVAPEAVLAPAMFEAEDKEDEEPVLCAGPRPNPLLPKSVRKRESGPNRFLVALGVLAALVFVGMAVMAPLRDAGSTVFSLSGGTGELNNVRLQLAAVTNYSSDVRQALAKADADANALKAAARAGDKAAIRSASRSPVIDQVWQKLSALSAPPGLTGAKENLTAGLLVRKNAITAAATAAGSAGPLDAHETLSRFDEADAQINKGLAAISKARATVGKQAAELIRRAKHGKSR